jgi:hypothetical protein
MREEKVSHVVSLQREREREKKKFFISNFFVQLRRSVKAKYVFDCHQQMDLMYRLLLMRRKEGEKEKLYGLSFSASEG